MIDAITPDAAAAAIKIHMMSRLSVIMVGPGTIPCRISTLRNTAISALPGIPNARVGTNAPPSFALLADSGAIRQRYCFSKRVTVAGSRSHDGNRVDHQCWPLGHQPPGEHRHPYQSRSLSAILSIAWLTETALQDLPKVDGLHLACPGNDHALPRD